MKNVEDAIIFDFLDVGDIFKCKEDGLLYKKTGDDFRDEKNDYYPYYNNAKCISKGIECYIPIGKLVYPVDEEEDDCK